MLTPADCAYRVSGMCSTCSHSRLASVVADVTVVVTITNLGHLENRLDSVSDPADRGHSGRPRCSRAHDSAPEDPLDTPVVCAVDGDGALACALDRNREGH